MPANDQAGLSSMPVRRQQLYFRPVSATLYCVMALTIVSLVMYTIHAAMRNVEELSGNTEESWMTETLGCASRSTAYPPMLCMIFISCRMYVLATTEGLGEPPVWVKMAMVIASLGMILQFLVVFMLPFSTETRMRQGLKMSVLAGEPNDVHPMLWAHKFNNDGVRVIVYAVQAMCIVCIYGGVGGVLVGIATFPPGKTQVSPAVVCTSLLGVLYLGVHLCLWVVRTNAELSPHTLSRTEKGIKGAVLAANMTVRKVPMLAIIFLAARMRALQLDPPYGMPPRWAQACFYASVVFCYLEAAVACYAGATCCEAAPERSHLGAYFYRSSPSVSIMQHACAFLVYACIVPIVMAIYAMKGADGKEAPLSTTMTCVLQLGSLFFFVHILQQAVFFAQDIRDTTLPKCQAAMLSAGVSVSLCPLLAVLFVACRMRALQITNQEGSPQGWAMNCMFLSVFATYSQAICCLVLPLFTGGGSKVDEDGSPAYEMRPMIAAWTVSIVKYVSLMCLHAGVIAVSVSIMTISPETALIQNEKQVNMFKDLMETATFVLIVGIIALALSSAKMVGVAVKLAIESVDKPLLGVDITVGKVVLGLCRGFVNVGHLVVNNPDDRQWVSPYLMKVDKVLIKINVWRLIRTMGHQFEITTLELEGVDICYDLPGLAKKGNVTMVLDHIASLADDAKASSPKATPPKVAARPKSAEPSKNQEGDEDEPPFMPVVIPKEIVIRDIGAGAHVSGAHMRVELEDIVITDFSSELHHNKGGLVAMIVRVILKTILKTVVSNKHLISHGLMSVGLTVMRTLSGKQQ